MIGKTESIIGSGLLAGGANLCNYKHVPSMHHEKAIHSALSTLSIVHDT